MITSKNRMTDISLKEVAFTTVMFCTVTLYNGVTCSVVPGERYRCPVVRVLEIIGQQQCVRKCRHRPKLCRGVNYRKRELLCELVTAIDETEPNPNYVRIKVDKTANVPDECLTCSSDDQCVTFSILLALALGKPTEQSSTFQLYGAQLAADGNRVLLCVVSLYEGVTSAVVPGERYRGPVVRVLEIIGKQQCVRECRQRPKLCRGVNYRKQELLCELVSAIDKTETNPDYVRIELNQTVNVPEMNQECLACSSDDQCVTLSSKKVHCIRAVSNLAFHKPATQSSTFTWAEVGLIYSANLAVDGNNGTDFVVDLCTSTAGGDTTPWWLVDLQAVYSIRSLRIFNRGMDKWGQDVSDRLRNVTVTVGLTESDVNTPCGFFAGPGTLSQLVVIACTTLPQGRFVKISMITEYLTLCEVEVFGYSV
ncbi:uncharacterized protein LOC128169101 [Crassostrea angulata]|uniref:uncharacterized protein LOC128169101 n=1 Tax=Magallana angulata TaxID=2784310 RepID=UPI0022B19630|nr:uncharacterized protein LOC128169101 [Crassostrea angulata]